MNFSATICSTKNLSESAKTILLERSIDVIEVEPLEVTYKLDVKNFSKVARLRDPIAVTSRHGIEGVVSNAVGRKLRSTGIFCLSGETRQAATRLGIPFIATADNARDLAARIIHAKVPSITYFCGEFHRPELPSLLRQNGTHVNEVVVYKISEKEVRPERAFDHVFFFSPRSAEVFLRHNSLPAQAVCFCIGETTATFLRSRTHNTVVVAPHPTQEDLVKTAIEFVGSYKKPEAAIL